jgi:4,5-dihydroxyphthalate decarboxylase
LLETLCAKEENLAEKELRKNKQPAPAITLDFASNYYPFFGEIMNGRYQAGGVDFRWHYVDPPNKLFKRVIRSPRYDITELSLSSYTMLRGQGWRSYKAFPIFTSRRFRHSAIFVRTDSALVSGEQLAGKRLGVPDFHMTAAVWIRGILQDDFGVRPQDIQWFTGRVERVRLPPEIAASVTPVGKEARLWDWLLEKKLDAVIYAHLSTPPIAVGPRAPVRCLFPDPVQIEQQYFRTHGVIPIMHLLALKEEHLAKGLGLARRIERILRQQKEAFYRKLELVSSSGLLPWFAGYVENTKAVLGRDPWPHGIEANAKALHTFLDYSIAQGLITERPRLPELIMDL